MSPIFDGIHDSNDAEGLFWDKGYRFVPVFLNDGCEKIMN